jgi:hypothetical protein
MRARDNRTLTALCAARRFLQEHAHLLPSIVESGLPRRLDAIISSVYSHLTDQVAHGTNAHRHLRTQQTLQHELRVFHMTPIVRIARADLPHTPYFQVLRMPRGKPTIDQLTSAAVAMAGTAERYAATFVAAGLPATFVDALHTAARELIESQRIATAARADRHAATRGIEASIIDGRHTLRALDSLLAVELQRDRALLTHWRALIAEPRLGRPRKKQLHCHK